MSATKRYIEDLLETEPQCTNCQEQITWDNFGNWAGTLCSVCHDDLEEM
jgi:hypothetical protein